MQHSTKVINARKNGMQQGIGAGHSLSNGAGGNGVHRNIRFVCPVQLKTPSPMGYSLTVGGVVSFTFSSLLVVSCITWNCTYSMHKYIYTCIAYIGRFDSQLKTGHTACALRQGSQVSGNSESNLRERLVMVLVTLLQCCCCCCCSVVPSLCVCLPETQHARGTKCTAFRERRLLR